MELSKKDRLILYNQYEILKYLNPEEEEEYDIKQEIIFNGYHKQYNTIIKNFSDDLDDIVANFVWDVLQMYRIINKSYDKLSYDDRNSVDLYDITFHGFDGNEETDYYKYACFIIKKLKRFKELYKMKGFELDSHCNSVEKYNKMLDKWFKTTKNRYELLSLKDLKKVIEK